MERNEPHQSGAYLRLLIPSLIDQPREIYLDSDTLVLSDIGEFSAIDMQGTPIASVHDRVGERTSKVPRAQDDTYINSGVLLLDIEALRNDDFLDKCEAIYHQHRETIIWLDQCIINKYAEGRKLIVDEKWNRQVFSHTTKYDQWQQLIANDQSTVIHFVGAIKPWMGWCNPFIAEFWWQIANQIGLQDLKPLKVENIDQALALTRVLDLNENYKEASKIKGNIIGRLLIPTAKINDRYGSSLSFRWM